MGGYGLELAKNFFEQNASKPEQIGLGPVLDSGKFEFAASRSTYDLGNFIIIVNDANYRDCLRLSLHLLEKIKAEHPEINPVVAGTDYRGSHQWVEITDPKDGQVIQIDCSPWYLGLDPGHKKCWTFNGDPKNELPKPIVMVIDKTTGPIISVRKHGTMFIDVGLTCFWPKMDTNSLAFRGIAGVNLEDESKRLFNRMLRIQGMPDYRFVVQAFLSEGPLSAKSKIMTMFIEVPDAEALADAMQTNGSDFHGLVAMKVVRIGTFTTLYRRDLDTHSESFAALGKNIVKDSDDEALFEAIRSDLPRVTRILEKTRRILNSHEDNEYYFDTRHGPVARHAPRGGRLKLGPTLPVGFRLYRNRND